MKLFTRYRILNATRAMVAEVGVERVTMRGIAALANITAPAIYKHFRNKRELLDEVVAHGYRELSNQMMRSGLKAEAGQRRLRVMINEAAIYTERHPRLVEMMFKPLSQDQEVVQRLEQQVEVCIQARVMKHGNPAELTKTIWSLIRGFLARRPEGNVRRRYDRSVHQLLRPLALEPELREAAA